MTQGDNGQQGILEWLALQIEPHSGVPIYLQLTQGFTRAIQRGTLRTGDVLPTVRQLAATLRLAPNTVMRAYAELQRLGLTESRAGAGTTVLSQLNTFSPVRAELLYEELQDLLHRMVGNGLSLSDIETQFQNFLSQQTQEAK